MKQPINILISIQLLFAILYIIHTKTYLNFGSDFMFFILVLSFVISGLIFWQIFKVRNTFGTKKIFGLVCASFPFLFILAMLSLFLFSR